MLSEKLVKELGHILKEDYSVQLSHEELAAFANDFADYFKILFEKEEKNE